MRSSRERERKVGEKKIGIAWLGLQWPRGGRRLSKGGAAHVREEGVVVVG